MSYLDYLLNTLLFVGGVAAIVFAIIGLVTMDSPNRRIPQSIAVAVILILLFAFAFATLSYRGSVGLA